MGVVASVSFGAAAVFLLLAGQAVSAETAARQALQAEAGQAVLLLDAKLQTLLQPPQVVVFLANATGGLPDLPVNGTPQAELDKVAERVANRTKQLLNETLEASDLEKVAFNLRMVRASGFQRAEWECPTDDPKLLVNLLVLRDCAWRSAGEQDYAALDRHVAAAYRLLGLGNLVPPSLAAKLDSLVADTLILRIPKVWVLGALSLGGALAAGASLPGLPRRPKTPGG